jgi:hypothetical protein
MIPYVPFCVLERPYAIWSADVTADNEEFLKNLDPEFYHRTVTDVFLQKDWADDQTRKDASSLARLLWHHGLETCVMLMAAFVQAPHAAHAYVLKCQTGDAVEFARMLLAGSRPKYHRLNDVPFCLRNLISGIHRSATIPDREEFFDNLDRAITDMLRDFISDDHRAEYNSIKHGLRAHHGRFGLAFGLEVTPGVEAPPENMQMIANSRDASHFNTAKGIGKDTKVHFKIERGSVSWSFEKCICDLQLLSIFMANIASALRKANGSKPGTLKFQNIARESSQAWWKQYFERDHCGVSNFRFSIDPTIPQKWPTKADIYKSYKS